MSDLEKMYMVTGHHRHGFVAEYPIAKSAAEAKKKVMGQLHEMAKPWKITSVDVRLYMTAVELQEYGGKS